MRLLPIICLLTASAVSAQDLVYSDADTQSCLESGRFYTDCVGLSAGACQANTPGGYSTVAEGGCLDAELQFWDRRLNQFYQQRMAEAKSEDATRPDYAPSQADALRGMQRSWITFRDRKCDYERSFWGGGTGGGPAAISCLLYETAEQANYLEYTGAN